MSVRHLFAALADSPAADRDLLDRFRRTRDEAAFAALVRRHGPMVWGVCRRVAGDGPTAEDAFQASFLVLALRAADAGRTGELGGWLHGVAVRTALKARRTVRRRAARERTGGTPPEPAVEPAPPADWVPVLDAELAALPDRLRLPVLLCDLQGLTLRAAADRLRLPVGTLSGRLTAGRATLARRLLRRGVGPAVAAAVAQVPDGLAATAARLGGLVLNGSAVAGPVVPLTNGVVRAMWWTKWQGLAAGLMVAAAGAGTVGVATGLNPADPPAKAAVAGGVPAGFDVAAWAAEWDNQKRTWQAAETRLKEFPPAAASAVLQKALDHLSEDQGSNHLVGNFLPHLTKDGDAAPILDLLDRGMRHPTAHVRTNALYHLKGFALRDFAEDFGAYERWYADNRPRKLPEVAQAAARWFAVTATRADVKALDNDFRQFPRAYGEAGTVAARAARLTQKLIALAQADSAGEDRNDGPRTSRAALYAAVSLRPAADEMRDLLLPLTADDHPARLQEEAGHALEWAARTGVRADWLRDFFRGWLLSYPKVGTPQALARSRIAAEGLGYLGDDGSIPNMIAVIACDNTYDTKYWVGHFGLTKLTGVRYDKAHDGDWWKAWWARNRAKFAPAVRELTVPDFPLVAKKKDDPPPAEPAAPTLRRPAAGRDYLLVGDTANPPAGGRKLLVVLPGGDGSEEFAPFVNSLKQHTLGADWLVAQAVAPPQVVWPTEKLNPLPQPVEPYLLAVVADAAKAAKIDPAHVYLFGWSSGGPACYATLLKPGSPFRGAVVAMSVFKPELLPPPAGAKGKRVFLLQSPADRVTPLRFAEAAEKALAAAGAAVKLQKYDGGHGWQGDAVGLIRVGTDWLSGN